MLCVCVYCLLPQPTIFSAENTDYLRLSADVTLSPDIPKQCVNVGIVDDAAVELNEMLTVTLSLTEQLSHVVFSEPNATLIIINDDSECEIPYSARDLRGKISYAFHGLAANHENVAHKTPAQCIGGMQTTRPHPRKIFPQSV